MALEEEIKRDILGRNANISKKAVQEKIQVALTPSLSADEIEPHNTSQPVSTDFTHHSISHVQPMESQPLSAEPALVSQPTPLREKWEIAMLKQAMVSLTADAANADEEIQTATFGEGKYRVIHHIPSETLRIVDETSHRGTLYKAQKGNLLKAASLPQLKKKPSYPQLS